MPNVVRLRVVEVRTNPEWRNQAAATVSNTVDREVVPVRVWPRGPMTQPTQEIYGVYKSSDQSCKAEFLSTPRTVVSFKPSMMHECHICNRTHSFNFDRSINANTPSLRRQLSALAVRHGWQRDVIVPDK